MKVIAGRSFWTRANVARAWGLALILAAPRCGGGNASDGHAPAAATSAAAPSAAVASPGLEASASAANAVSASAPASASVPVAPAPASDIVPPVAPGDLPSAHIHRPPSINKVAWQRIFETYGRLLDLDDTLQGYHRRYPDKTQVVTLGTTIQGRKLSALLIADHPAEARGRPAVLLNGAHHGDEPLSASIVLDAIDTLLSKSDSDPRIKRYLSELAIWCVPMVNPDGFATFMTDFSAGRKNARENRGKDRNKPLSVRGVDLNRNYPFRWGYLKERGSRSAPDRKNHRGPEPASEPEVRAMVALSDQQHFVGSISFHIGTIALLAPYTIDGVPNPSPNEAWIVAETVARSVRPDKERPVYVRKNLYPVDGTDQDYHRGAHGTLALLFEAAHRSWETPQLKQKTLDGIRPSWGALFDRYLDGPSVEGHVKDEQGRPVAAQVSVVEMETHAGEVWKSRCPDGFFGRYLPGFGRFTVRVSIAGRSPVDTSVEVSPGKGRAQIDIVVPGAGADVCAAGKN